MYALLDLSEKHLYVPQFKLVCKNRFLTKHATSDGVYVFAEETMNLVASNGYLEFRIHGSN
jgi:hypothetical protein